MIGKCLNAKACRLCSSHVKTYFTRPSRQCSFDGRLTVETRLDVLPMLATDVLLTRQLTNLSLQFQ
jgi:hypothetical protein